jgi:hypothetical protein
MLRDLTGCQHYGRLIDALIAATKKLVEMLDDFPNDSAPLGVGQCWRERPHGVIWFDGISLREIIANDLLFF